jgi:TonB family protein
MSLWTRFINLFRTGSLEREFDDELRFHIESRIARNVQEGMTPEGAEEQARRQFGNRSRITREMQEVRVMKTSIGVAVLAGLLLCLVAGAFVWRRGGEPLSPSYYKVSDEGVVPPSVVREQKPIYTPEAMQARIEGTVLMECVVQTTGICEDIQVARSLDPMWLDQEAVKAVQEWRFSPGRRMGEPVPVMVNIEMRFTLR